MPSSNDQHDSLSTPTGGSSDSHSLILSFSRSFSVSLPPSLSLLPLVRVPGKEMRIYIHARALSPPTLLLVITVMPRVVLHRVSISRPFDPRSLARPRRINERNVTQLSFVYVASKERQVETDERRPLEYFVRLPSHNTTQRGES